jgi:hypothetical protein
MEHLPSVAHREDRTSVTMALKLDGTGAVRQVQSASVYGSWLSQPRATDRANVRIAWPPNQGAGTRPGTPAGLLGRGRQRCQTVAQTAEIVGDRGVAAEPLGSSINHRQPDARRSPIEEVHL